jgi:hypothetical protein
VPGFLQVLCKIMHRTRHPAHMGQICIGKHTDMHHILSYLPMSSAWNSTCPVMAFPNPTIYGEPGL